MQGISGRCRDLPLIFFLLTVLLSISSVITDNGNAYNTLIFHIWNMEGIPFGINFLI